MNCKHCHGTAGSFFDGAHSLCSARARRNAPTPSLGNTCPCCHGTGCHPRSAYGPINPNQDAVERWAPGCITCQATGAVNREEKYTGHQIPKHWYERCVIQP